MTLIVAVDTANRTFEVITRWKQAQQPSSKIVAKVTDNEWAFAKTA